MVGRSRLAVATALATMLAAVACSADRTTSVTVFAAASLTEPFGDLQARLKTSDPGLALTFGFGGSGALVTQVQQGAPADVIATADPASMNKLRDAGLVDPPASFATNRLEILVEPGNPRNIRGLQDLSRNDVKLVVADENVPAGRYSAQALQAAGVTVRPVSKEADVKAAVAKVTAGEADATIVYVTDVRSAGSRGQGVTIPEGLNVVAEYLIAVVRTTRNRIAAAAFLTAVVEGDGQGELRRRGFLPAK